MKKCIVCGKLADYSTFVCRRCHSKIKIPTVYCKRIYPLKTIKIIKTIIEEKR